MTIHQNFKYQPAREKKHLGPTLFLICIMTLAWTVFALLH